MARGILLLICGEGKSDSSVRDSPVDAAEEVGVLGVFTDTLLRHLGGAAFEAPRYLSLPARSLNPRVRGVPYLNKYVDLLKLAMIHADLEGCHGVIYVIDSREMKKENAQIMALRSIRDQTIDEWPKFIQDKKVSDSEPPQTAIGTAIHEIEAWLLADGDKARLILNTLDKNEFPNAGAEKMGNPKEDNKRGWLPLFRRHCQRAKRNLDEKETRIAVARSARPQVLQQRCPNGYAPFLSEVSARILPLVSLRSVNPGS